MKENASSNKLKFFALVLTMMTSFALISCEQSLRPLTTGMTIYQPSILNLEAGTTIQTKDGVYTPQVDEIWHSDKRYRTLEREVYYTTQM